MSAPEVRRVSKVNRRGSKAIANADPQSLGGAGSVASRNVEIAPEEIARLAYSHWEARGFQEGSAEEDWLRAEQQLKVGN